MKYLAKNMALLIENFVENFFLSEFVSGYFNTKKKELVASLMKSYVSTLWTFVLHQVPRHLKELLSNLLFSERKFYNEG